MELNGVMYVRVWDKITNQLLVPVLVPDLFEYKWNVLYKYDCYSELNFSWTTTHNFYKSYNFYNATSSQYWVGLYGP